MARRIDEESEKEDHIEVDPAYESVSEDEVSSLTQYPPPGLDVQVNDHASPSIEDQIPDVARQLLIQHGRNPITVRSVDSVQGPLGRRRERPRASAAAGVCVVEGETDKGPGLRREVDKRGMFTPLGPIDTRRRRARRETEQALDRKYIHDLAGKDSPAAAGRAPGLRRRIVAKIIIAGKQ
ncbi:hypothetical protein EVAR_94078_1 [Eumeta japonica]|uniref:Uncharacterized protein n=1 Tax=Eumeta variegata TaxID=151549 RepID=A0A4C1V8H9_EUMVA|nr:hypothetical protein EVAR_94078_1 [Eumeta japonica]